MGEGDGKGREMRVGEGKGEVDGWVRKEIEMQESERIRTCSARLRCPAGR